LGLAASGMAASRIWAWISGTNESISEKFLFLELDSGILSAGVAAVAGLSTSDSDSESEPESETEVSYSESESEVDRCSNRWRKGIFVISENGFLII
jgi:hypothetical protein